MLCVCSWEGVSIRGAAERVSRSRSSFVGLAPGPGGSFVGLFERARSVPPTNLDKEDMSVTVVHSRRERRPEPETAETPHRESRQT